MQDKAGNQEESKGGIKQGGVGHGGGGYMDIGLGSPLPLRNEVREWEHGGIWAEQREQHVQRP